MQDLHAFYDSDASLRSLHINGFTFFIDCTASVWAVMYIIDPDGHAIDSRDVPYAVRHQLTHILLQKSFQLQGEPDGQLSMFPESAGGCTFTSTTALHYVYV